VLPDGAITIGGRKQRGREVRKMLKDSLEVQASQKAVEKKIAEGIYRERISVPAPSRRCMHIIYISIKYH